jgi:hypothetical protein
MLTTTMARIQTNLESAQVSAAILAKLSGVPVSTLKEALADQRYLGAEKEAELLTLAVRVSSLVEAWKPMTFPKGDTESLRVLLESERTAAEIRKAVSTIFGRESE